MAPTQKERASKAAERQRKREKLKREGLYEQYKAKNANESRKFRRMRASALEIMNQEDKARVIHQRRERETELENGKVVQNWQE